MSQTAVLVRVNGNLHNEVFSSVPDYDDAIQICKDFGYEASDGSFPGDYILVEYEWLDIGDGESGTDTFYDDETLLHIYDSYGYEEVIEADGYNVEVVESGSYEVLYEELDEEV